LGNLDAYASEAQNFLCQSTELNFLVQQLTKNIVHAAVGGILKIISKFEQL